MAPNTKYVPSSAKQVKNAVKNKGRKTKKYDTSKSKKGVDKTLSMDYLKKKFLAKDKMELKMSPFRDSSQFGNSPQPLPNIPTPFTSGYLVYEWGDTLSGPIATFPACYPIGGFNFNTPETVFVGGGAGAAPAQVNDSTRLLNGQSACFKKSYFSVDVAVDPIGWEIDPDNVSVASLADRINANYQPLQFRVLHLLQRRDNYPQPTNNPISIKTDMWLTDTGKFEGLNNARSGNRLMTQRVATANFRVISDQRFVLQGSNQVVATPQIGGDYITYQSNARSKYPSSKSISMVYDHREEIAQIEQDGLAPSNEPIDMNFKHIILILCTGMNAFTTTSEFGSNIGEDCDATNWQAGAYGTTTCYDA